jgi:hypothetical protein
MPLPPLPQQQLLLLLLLLLLAPPAALAATATFTVAGVTLVRVGDGATTYSGAVTAPIFLDDFDAASFVAGSASGCASSAVSSTTVATASCLAGGTGGFAQAAAGVPSASGSGVWTSMWMFPVNRAGRAYVPCVVYGTSGFGCGGTSTAGQTLPTPGGGGGGCTVSAKGYGVATFDIAGASSYTCTAIPTGGNDFNAGPLRGVETDGTSSLWLSGSPATTKPGLFKYSPPTSACGGSGGTRVAPGLPASLYQLRQRPAAGPWPALFTAAAGSNVTYGVRTPLWAANSPAGDGVRAFDFQWATSGWPAACGQSASGATIAAFDWAAPSANGVPAPAWAVATLWFGELSGCLPGGANLVRVFCTAAFTCPFDANSTAWTFVGPPGSAVTGVLVLAPAGTVWATVASASASSFHQVLEGASNITARLVRTAAAKTEFRSLYATPDLGANTPKVPPSCTPSVTPSASPTKSSPTPSPTPSGTSTVTSSGTPTPSPAPPLAAIDPSLNVAGSGLSAGAFGGILGGIAALAAAGVGGVLYRQRQARDRARALRRANVGSRAKAATTVYGVHESRSKKEIEAAARANAAAVRVTVMRVGGDDGGDDGGSGDGGGSARPGGLASRVARRAEPAPYVDPYDAAVRAAEEEAEGEDEEPERPNPLAGLARPNLTAGGSRRGTSLTAKAEPARSSRGSSLTAKAEPGVPSRPSSGRGTSLTARAEPAPQRPSRGGTSLTAKAEPAPSRPSRGSSAPARPARR